MKIAFMTAGTIKGSLSYRPLAFARELVRKGHDVYVFAPRFDKYSTFKDERITEIDGVKIMRPWQLKTFSFEIGLLPYIISSIVMLYRLNPDLIHMFKPNPLTLTGLFIKFLRKTPVILDLDDMDSDVMKIENNPKLKVKLVEISEKLAARSVNSMTAASKFLYELYSLNKNKVTYMPNGAAFIKAQDVNKNNVSEAKIVFVGAMNRINILEPLFHALKSLKEQGVKVSATVIGDGEYFQYFRDLAKRLKVNDRVRFTGLISQDQLHKYIKSGDIGYCYMPNELTTRACSSMKVFQYMQFGAVPLVSNVGDLPSYTFNGKAGYIAKHDNNKDLVQKIITILKNKEDKIEKIKYSQKNAAKKFSWRVLASELEKLYIEVIKI